MYPPKRSHRFTIAFVALFFGLCSGLLQAASFSITRAEWSSSDGGRLRVEGLGTSGRTVAIKITRTIIEIIFFMISVF